MNKSFIRIERAKPEDAEIICDIRDRAWLQTYPNAGLGITEEDIRLNAQGMNGVFLPRRIAYLKKKLSSDTSDVTIYVAKVEEEVIGYIDPYIDDSGDGHIGAIYVAPEFQGKGVGGSLMEHVLEMFGGKRDIYLEVVSYNENAISFYKKFGFEQTDNTVSEEEGRPDYMINIPQIEMVLKSEVDSH